MNGKGNDAKQAANGRGASEGPATQDRAWKRGRGIREPASAKGAQSKMVGHSGPSSLVAALVSHDPRIHRGDCDWTSSRFCHLRENTRAIAPPFLS